MKIRFSVIEVKELFVRTKLVGKPKYPKIEYLNKL